MSDTMHEFEASSDADDVSTIVPVTVPAGKKKEKWVIGNVPDGAHLPIIQRVVNEKMLASAAPQIFKRNGTVKTCPRKLQVKMGFKAKLDMYNMTKKAVNDNFKYDVEPKITFCTSEFSVTLRGDLAMFIVEENNDILAQVLDAGWVVC